MKKFIFFARVFTCLLSFPTWLIAQDADPYPNYVVIGAFASEKNAIFWTDDANNNSYSAKFQINPNRNLFYVYILTTDDRKLAFQEASKLRRDTKYFDTWVYSGALGTEVQKGIAEYLDLNPATEERLSSVVAEENDLSKNGPVIGENNGQAGQDSLQQNPAEALSNVTDVAASTKRSGKKSKKKAALANGVSGTKNGENPLTNNQGTADRAGVNTSTLKDSGDRQLAGGENGPSNDGTLTTNGDITQNSSHNNTSTQNSTLSADINRSSNSTLRNTTKDKSAINSENAIAKNGLITGDNLATDQQTSSSTTSTTNTNSPLKSGQADTKGQTLNNGNGQDVTNADKQGALPQNAANENGTTRATTGTNQQTLVPGKTKNAQQAVSSDGSTAGTVGATKNPEGQKENLNTAATQKAGSTANPNTDLESGETEANLGLSTTAQTSGNAEEELALSQKSSNQNVTPSSKNSEVRQSPGTGKAQQVVTPGLTTAANGLVIPTNSEKQKTSKDNANTTGAQKAGSPTDKNTAVKPGQAEANAQLSTTAQVPANAEQQLPLNQKSSNQNVTPTSKNGEVQKSSGTGKTQQVVTPGLTTAADGSVIPTKGETQKTTKGNANTAGAQKAGSTTDKNTVLKAGQSEANARLSTTAQVPGNTAQQVAVTQPSESQNVATISGKGDVKQVSPSDKTIEGETAVTSPVNPAKGKGTIVPKTGAAKKASTDKAANKTIDPAALQSKQSADTTTVNVAANEKKESPGEINPKNDLVDLKTPEGKTIVKTSPIPENLPPLTPEEVIGKNFYFKLYRGSNMAVVDGEVDAIDLEKSRRMATYKGNTPVKVLMPPGKGKPVTFVCEVFGYRKLQRDFDPANPSPEFYLDEDNNLVLPFQLVRLQKGDIAIMYNVFFFKDAGVMRPESRYEVNNLLELLNENPTYKIVIHGHTNGNAAGKILSLGGTDNYYSLAGAKEGFGSAKKLSEERAEVMRQYLISKGVDPARMQVTAWGGKKPIHDKHAVRAQENVRVEIEILSD